MLIPKCWSSETVGFIPAFQACVCGGVISVGLAPYANVLPAFQAFNVAEALKARHITAWGVAPRMK